MNGATPGDHHDFVRPVPVLVNDTQPRRWGDLECMPVTVVNPLSHPQVLFRGFEEDDPRLTRMRHLVGASHLLTGDTLKGLRAEDWDVLVVERAPVTASIPGTSTCWRSTARLLAAQPSRGARCISAAANPVAR